MAASVTTHRYLARLVVMAVLGVAAGVISGVGWGPIIGLVVGWAAASLVFVAWVWLVVGRMGPEATATHAVREDPARAVAEFLILFASVASLAAVGLLLIESRLKSNGEAGTLAAMAVVSVALSWLMIHTLFTLRYASQYFAGSVRGIDFNTESPPRYVDFAYVAFSVGMTFQISDTNLRTSEFRAIALRHALLSYLFGTIIVATTINLGVNLSS